VIGWIHGGDRAHSEKVVAVTKELEILKSGTNENKINEIRICGCHCNNGWYQCVQSPEGRCV